MKKISIYIIILTFLISTLLPSSIVSAQTTVTYSTSAINSIIEQIRAAINALSAIPTYTSSSGSTSTGGTTGSTATNCTVTINASVLNVRSAPSVSGSLVRQLTRGQTFTASGSVNGDMVEGSNKWWRTSDGNFIWAGGTSDSSNCSSNTSTGGTAGGTGSNSGSTGSTSGGNTSLPIVGSGNGCTLLSSSLSDGMRVIAVRAGSGYSATNSGVVVTDDKVTTGTSIYMFSPIVEQYDGWAKINVNGIDYPIAGPGTAPVAGQPYSTSGQNHTALNRFDINVPSLPVADGSSITIKLFKAGNTGSPYTIQKTFKYYSSLPAQASDPLILPQAKLGQVYSAPLTAKCGGSVSWEPRILTGILPRAFDIVGGNLIYNPATNEVTPQVGDVGTFFMLGKNGTNDVIQHFYVNVVSAYGTGGTSGTTNGTDSSPTVSSISPNRVTVAELIFGRDITITGLNIGANNNVRIDFYQGTGLMGSVSNVSVNSTGSIKGRIPSTLQAGAYTVQVTVNNTLATSIDPAMRTLIVSPF